ncbi:MAG: RNase P subunit p30 family protein [Methanolinea sp.]
MQYTDACVFPLPLGDSSLRRMALEARELGFDSIVAAGVAGSVYRGIEIIGGTLIHAKETREVQAVLRKDNSQRSLPIVSAGGYSFNRAVIQAGWAKVIREIHATPRNSFDHIISRMAADKQVAVDLDLSVLIQERGYMRQKVLQRYADLVSLQGRFDFPFTISSGARSILDMKSRRDMIALCGLFGLDRDGALSALGNVSRIIHREKSVEVVG